MSNIDDWLAVQSTTKHSKIAQKKSKHPLRPRPSAAISLDPMGEQEHKEEVVVDAHSTPGEVEAEEEVVVVDNNDHASVEEEEEDKEKKKKIGSGNSGVPEKRDHMWYVSGDLFSDVQDRDRHGKEEGLLEQFERVREKRDSSDDDVDNFDLDEEDLDAELRALESKLQIGNSAIDAASTAGMRSKNKSADNAAKSSVPTTTSASYGTDSYASALDDDLFDLMGSETTTTTSSSKPSSSLQVGSGDIADIGAYIAKSRAERQKPASLFD